MGKKKIVFWTEDFYPTIGGTEMSIYRQITSLREMGHDVVVITPDSAHLNFQFIKIVTNKEDYISEGAEIIMEKYLNFDLIYVTRIFKGDTLSHLKSIREISDAGRVVIRIPTTGNLNEISQYPLNYYLHNVSGFICLNDAIREEICRYLTAPKVFIQKNGIPLSNFTVSKFSEEGNFLFAGRVTANKGIDVLLKAWERYRRNGGKRNLVIIPTFRLPHRNQYLEDNDWLNQYGVILRCTLKDLWKDIDSICAIIIPSLKEGHSNLMLEAMASRVPIIASRIPGLMEDISTSGGGILFEKEDTRELSKILLNVDLNRHDLKSMGEKGRRFVSLNRTIEQTVSNLLEIIILS